MDGEMMGVCQLLSCLACLAARCGQNELYKTAIPETGVRNLFTGVDFKPQTAHNDAAGRKCSFSDFAFISSGPEVGKLYLRKPSHQFDFYPDAKKRKLADSLKKDATKWPPFSVFIGRRYVEHAGAK